MSGQHRRVLPKSNAQPPHQTTAVVWQAFLFHRVVCLFVNFLLFDIWKVRREAQSRSYFLEKQNFLEKCWSSSFLLEKLVKTCVPIPRHDSIYFLGCKGWKLFLNCCRLIQSVEIHKEVLLFSQIPIFWYSWQLRRLYSLSGHSVPFT